MLTDEKLKLTEVNDRLENLYLMLDWCVRMEECLSNIKYKIILVCLRTWYKEIQCDK